MEKEVIQGTVSVIIFVNELNRYTICKIETDDGESITVAGSFADLNPGERLTITGSFVFNQKYGKQFNVETYEKELPSSADVIFKYLASGAIKGIGAVTAKNIVEKFGDDTLDVIENNPELLATVKGVTLAKAKKYSLELSKQNSARMIIISLMDIGIPTHHAIKVYEAFGETAISTVEQNPYSLYESIRGFDFPACDELAAQLGFDGDFSKRLETGLRYMLRFNLQNGHTYLPRKQLTELTSKMLSVEQSKVDEALISSISKNLLIAFGENGNEKIFLPDYFYAEKSCAERIKILSSAKTKNLNYEKQIKKIETQNNIQYSKKQLEAIQTSSENTMFILTGGPGTGKTTTIRGIISLFENHNMKIILAAPTGRAAKRMTELTSREAKTIHRLLEVIPSEDDELPVFSRDESSPLECDAIIIDELSMVDVIVFDALLKAIRPGTKIVLVGDYNQLPSVGPGNILEDIINSEMITCINLDIIFRQSSNSLIVTNAHQIVNGQLPILNDTQNDFFFLSETSSEKAAETAISLCCERLPKAYKADPIKDIQIITPTKIGDTGTVILNEKLQAKLNPPVHNKNEKKYGHITFREGDKVMQIKNNYDITYTLPDGSIGSGIYNGDIGIITAINNDEPFMHISFDGRKTLYSYEWLNQLEHSYAITVHKSQGSEYKFVVLLTTAPKKLLYRNLLYTAITRAKEKCIIVGSKEEISYMIANTKEKRRYTALSQMLKLLMT